MKLVHRIPTAFGVYPLSESEILNFMRVYGDDWWREAVQFAEAQMKSQWMTG